MTGGPVVRQDDMLAVWPSQYPAETIMDFFTYAGAPGTYSLNLGAGAGLSYAGDILGMDGFAVGANYVAANGADSFDGGIAADGSNGTGTVQIAYTGDDWNLTAAYAYNQNFGAGAGYIPVGTPLASDPFGGISNSFSAGSSPSVAGSHLTIGAAGCPPSALVGAPTATQLKLVLPSGASML